MKVSRQAYCDRIRIPTWISGGRTGFSRLHLYLEDDSEMCVLSGSPLTTNKTRELVWHLLIYLLYIEDRFLAA